MEETMKFKNLFLSITLLASFAGVKAMENGENNNQDNIQQMFNTVMGPLNIIQQYLIQHGMINPEIIENNNFGFGYHTHTTTNNEGQVTTKAEVIIYDNNNNEKQTINITALWPEIQNLINNPTNQE